MYRIAITAETGLPMAATSNIVRKLIRMWISIRNSGGQRSEQLLVSCGPQGWGRPLVSVARFVQRRRWERW